MIAMWTNNLSVNIKGFDEDHKLLIRTLNELHMATRQLDADGKLACEEIEFALHRLENHFLFHCTAEEKAMAMTGYPDLETHREEHQKLARILADLSSRFRGSTSPQHAEELMQVLHDWIANHINGIDKQYSEHLNGNGIF